MYKTKLQELCHRKRWSLPIYSSMKDGPDHNPRFKSSVSVNGLCFHSTVSCKSSKESQNDAAELAYFHFTSPPSSSTTKPVADGGSEFEEIPQRLDTDGADSLGISLIPSTEVAAGGPPDILSQDSVNKYDLQCRYKTLLQNYAQRKNLDSPKYSSIKAGPPHAPCFKATVTVDGHTFDSLEFFKNLKQAEQAAAKVALMSLSSDGFQEDDSVFYKTLLHQLSHKEDLPVPLYQTIKCGEPHMPTFFSMVEVDSEVFYGMAGRSKKDAEMKAAKVAYTALIERRQKHNTRALSPPVETDETPKSTLSSDTVDSQNLDQKCVAVSPPVPEHEKNSNGDAAPDNVEVISSEDFIPCPIVQSTDDFIGNIDTLPASPGRGSSPSPPTKEPDLSALSLTDSDTGTATATGISSSYLLCNRVRVYPCIPDIEFPKGITIMPISDNKWVAMSLEFPNEEAN